MLVLTAKTETVDVGPAHVVCGSVVEGAISGFGTLPVNESGSEFDEARADDDKAKDEVVLPRTVTATVRVELVTINGSRSSAAGAPVLEIAERAHS